MIHLQTGKREAFCQLVAAGLTYTDAYLEAYQKPADYERKGAAEEGSRLMAMTDMRLRVQELRRPVILKLRRKIEYSLNQALGQCQVAYDLAYEKGDVRGILKAVEMQARLAKLLSDEFNGNPRFGGLDDASTETLLAIRKEVEVRREKQNKLAVIPVVNREPIGQPPHEPLSICQNGSHLTRWY